MTVGHWFEVLVSLGNYLSYTHHYTHTPLCIYLPPPSPPHPLGGVGVVGGYESIYIYVYQSHV